MKELDHLNKWAKLLKVSTQKTGESEYEFRSRLVAAIKALYNEVSP